MPKKTKCIFRVVMEAPSEGIERSLPYPFESEQEAQDVADALNTLLRPRFSHRVEPAFTHHISDNGKEHTYAYHGRH